MQKCRPPSVFWTNTTALYHTLWLGQITPQSNISCKCMWASSNNGRGIHLNHSLNGVSSVTLITCLVEWVQPSSLCSSEKMSWHSAKRDWVEAASSGSQDCNPLRSTSSNNFSSLCFTINLGVWWPWTISNTCQTSLHRGLWYPSDRDCPHHWGLLPQSLGICRTFSHYHSDILTATAQLCITIRPWGRDPSSAYTAWVITLIPSPVWAVLILACITWKKKASSVLVSLMVTISSYSLGSASPATVSPSSIVALAHQTARR